MVEQSGGNALYLEELIRTAAEYKRADMPRCDLDDATGASVAAPARAATNSASRQPVRGVFWRGGIVSMLARTIGRQR